MSNNKQVRISNANVSEVNAVVKACKNSGTPVSVPSVVNMALASGLADVRKRLLGAKTQTNGQSH